MLERVCVIGAGSSGIASCQVLHERAIPFDCFEAGSTVGGNWRYENDNGMSAAYRSLYINTSRRRMEYAAFPMPEDYPDYPHHAQIARYFDAYVDHFGFREHIRFCTEVTLVEPAAAGGWDVTTSDGHTRRYRAVLVANGHHWDQRWPDFQGAFAGEQMHAHQYRTPEIFDGRRVLVLGMGNSAMDIASESSRWSEATFLASRRGAWIIPKYLKGRPTDELANPVVTRLPVRVQSRIYRSLLATSQGPMENYGLPKPDHRVLEAHPTISSDLLQTIGHGRTHPKPNVKRLEGDSVRFVDGSSERVDLIVWATGYNITFPFLRRTVLNVEDNEVSLYRRVAHPDLANLFFIGLVQPLGAIMPLAEEQSKWVAELLTGVAVLPPRSRMHSAIERDTEQMRRRYVTSTRHTIQVDYDRYLRQLRRERVRGKVERQARGTLGGGARAVA